MFEHFLNFICKGSVFVVDIKKIAAEIIIADVNIFPAIPVDIQNGNAQTISFPGNACFFGNIGVNRVIELCIPVITV